MTKCANKYPATDEEALAAPNYGGRFKAEWFRYYRVSAPNWLVFGDKKYRRESLHGRFLTVDAAASVKETAKDDPDYTVICSWARTSCGLLVWLGCLRIRVEFPDIVPAAAREYVKWNCGKGIFEGGGMQKGVPQTARRHRLPNGSYMNVVDYNPGGRDKLDRAADFLNMAEAGRVWLPQDDPAFPMAEVKSELLRFTGNPKHGGHDDIWDCCAAAGTEMTSGTWTNQVYSFVGQGTFGCIREGMDFWGW